LAADGALGETLHNARKGGLLFGAITAPEYGISYPDNVQCRLAAMGFAVTPPRKPFLSGWHPTV